MVQYLYYFYAREGKKSFIILYYIYYLELYSVLFQYNSPDHEPALN